MGQNLLAKEKLIISTELSKAVDDDDDLYVYIRVAMALKNSESLPLFVLRAL